MRLNFCIRVFIAYSIYFSLLFRGPITWIFIQGTSNLDFKKSSYSQQLGISCYIQCKLYFCSIASIIRNLGFFLCYPFDFLLYMDKVSRQWIYLMYFNVKRNAENSVKIDRFRESEMKPSWPSAVICQFWKFIVFI